ncbi:MAG: CARDB domain-containing protein, partial [Candidatus Thermoplasmatota archaeon]|nr:CARDB domain-containing protein [Candidatus Thermoplasmatota archaeon]
VTLLDGCIQSAIVDINDPTLHVSGTIIGDAHSMVSEFAKLRIAMNGDEVASIDIVEGPFSANVSVGHLLTPGGGDIEVGLSARFHWSSDGSSEDIVIQTEEMNIDGGFLIEWDRDPTCDGQTDQIFDEDGGGRLLDFLYTCSDDITPNADLVVTVSSSDPSILEANFVNGQVRLQPVADAHGEATATITVMDERQNTWSDEISVLINPVDDSPEMDSLPVELTMELNDPYSIAFAYWDRDTPSNLLNVDISPNWAIFSAGTVELNPTQTGTHIVTITVSDGSTTITQNLSVIVTQRADLWVQSIGILDRNTGSSSITEGNDIAIEVFVRNSGSNIAQPVTVRCSVDGQTIGTPQIAMISPGGLESASCEEWNRLDIQSGEVTLEIEIDWTDDIDEVNELNNLWSTVLMVEANDVSSPDNAENQETSAMLNEYNSYIWVGVIILGLLGILVFMYGPNQIRKIE